MTLKTILIVFLGYLLVIVGFFLSIPGVPAPGFLIILAGLSLLGTQYEWAKKLMDKIKAKFKRA